MHIIIIIVVIVLQFIIGNMLGFGVAYAIGVSQGWALVMIPIGNTLGVWGIGAIAAKLRGTFVRREYWTRLIGAAIGSAIGVVFMLILPMGLIFPLVGVFLGYYLAPRIRR